MYDLQVSVFWGGLDALTQPHDVEDASPCMAPPQWLQFWVPRQATLRNLMDLAAQRVRSTDAFMFRCAVALIHKQMWHVTSAAVAPFFPSFSFCLLAFSALSGVFSTYTTLASVDAAAVPKAAAQRCSQWLCAGSVA